MQAAAIAVQGTDKARKQILVPCGRGLRDDHLAMADAEIGQLEAVRIERPLTGLRGGIVVRADPAQYVDWQP